MKVWNLLRKKLKPIFLKLQINKTCIDFGLLLSRIYIIMVSYCILYRVNYISIYTYVILLIIYVLSYTCISVTVSGYLHTLHLYFVILCFVLHMYFCDSNCICYLYLRYFIHRIIFILYMYFCDIICICFYVQYVEHILDIHCIYTYVNVFVIYSLSYTCISVIVIVLCYLYLRYFMHRLNFILYMYFCDIICICFYVQSVEHFVDIGL